MSSISPYTNQSVYMLIMASLIIQTFVCNPYQQSTYVVHAEGQPSCIIIDAGMYDDDEKAQVNAYLRDQHLSVAAVLITHTHPDHICGLNWLKSTYSVTTVIDASTTEKEHTIAGMHIQTIATPGHKEDCLCFAVKPLETKEGEKEGLPVLFSGDTLFRQSVGRTDMPGGNYNILIQSLHLLMKLPDAMTVYPGHGEPTTIGYERKFNPFI